MSFDDDDAFLRHKHKCDLPHLKQRKIQLVNEGYYWQVDQMNQRIEMAKAGRFLDKG
jgi:hypothetical protein